MGRCPVRFKMAPPILSLFLDSLCFRVIPSSRSIIHSSERLSGTSPILFRLLFTDQPYPQRFFLSSICGLYHLYVIQTPLDV